MAEYWTCSKHKETRPAGFTCGACEFEKQRKSFSANAFNHALYCAGKITEEEFMASRVGIARDAYDIRHEGQECPGVEHD